MKYALCFLCILFFGGCREKKVDDGMTILVELDKVEKVRLEDVFSEIEIIPLETLDDVLLGSKVRLMEVKDTFYLYDRKQGVLFSFGPDGTYLSNSRHLVGEGATSIIPHDIVYNPYTGDFEMFNAALHKMLICDINFNFKRIEILPSGEIGFIHYVASFDKDCYLFSDYDKFDIIGYSISQNKELFRFKNDFPKIRMGVDGDGWVFSYYHTELRYTPNYYNNTVYKIDRKKGVIPLWNIDFGKYNIQKDREMNKYTTQYLLPMRKDETDSLIIVCMTNTQDYYWATYSKLTKR